MKRSIKLSVVALGLISILSATLHFRQQAPTSSVAFAAVTHKAAPTSLIDLNGPLNKGYLWQKGDSATYHIDHKVSINDEASGWAVDANGSEDMTTIQGNLHLLVLGIDGTSATLGFQASDLVVMADGHRNEILESLLNDFPQIVQMNSRGKILSRSFPNTLPLEDRDLLAGLTQIQWVLGQGSVWTTKETDSTGTYTCIYRDVDSSEVMTKSRKATSIGDMGFDARIVQSEFKATRGTLWLDSLSGLEEIALSYEGNSVVTMRSEISLQRQSTSSTLPMPLTDLTDAKTRGRYSSQSAGLVLDGPARDSANARHRRARLEEDYGDVLFAAMIEQLSDAFANAESHSDTLPAIQAMQEWLEVNPEQAFQVADALANDSLDEGLTARLIHALELASPSTPEAQEVLGEILQNRSSYPGHAVLQAIVASGDVGPLHDSKIYDGLSDIIAHAESPDVEDDYQWSDAALFAVGNLAETNANAKEALITALNPRLLDPGSYHPSDLVTALHSLANGRISDPEILEASAALGSHPEAQVRAAVIDYMHLATPEDESYAIQALEDSSDSVKASAIAALADPETATQDSLKILRSQLGRQDLSDSIQSALTNALAQNEL